MTARILYADSDQSADMLYATGLFIPDPFWFIQDLQGQRHLLVSPLEVDRARRTARVDRVHDWEECRRRWPVAPGEEPQREIQLVVRLLGELGITEALVPEDFPLHPADRLREEGIRLTTVAPFWPERACKRPDEVEALTEALRITAIGMAAGIEMIRSADIADDGALWVDGVVLTSERVRGVVHGALVREGASPRHTIIAGGTQGADPHEVGSGPLFAHQPIILDIFPRIDATGCWGDMTRTVCRGSAPEPLKRQWQAVQTAQQRAMALVREGADTGTIHVAVLDAFAAMGFVTGVTESGRQCGFFHGTGHGLGLEVHEFPRLGRKGEILVAGHVVTVEPGLYYPEIGGVRLEDVVVVTADGYRLLSDFPQFLEV